MYAARRRALLRRLFRGCPRRLRRRRRRPPPAPSDTSRAAPPPPTRNDQRTSPEREAGTAHAAARDASGVAASIASRGDRIEGREGARAARASPRSKGRARRRRRVRTLGIFRTPASGARRPPPRRTVAEESPADAPAPTLRGGTTEGNASIALAHLRPDVAAIIDAVILARTRASPPSPPTPPSPRPREGPSRSIRRGEERLASTRGVPWSRPRRFSRRTRAPLRRAPRGPPRESSPRATRRVPLATRNVSARPRRFCRRPLPRPRRSHGHHAEHAAATSSNAVVRFVASVAASLAGRRPHPRRSPSPSCRTCTTARIDRAPPPRRRMSAAGCLRFPERHSSELSDGGPAAGPGPASRGWRTSARHSKYRHVAAHHLRPFPVQARSIARRNPRRARRVGRPRGFAAPQARKRLSRADGGAVARLERRGQRARQQRSATSRVRGVLRAIRRSPRELSRRALPVRELTSSRCSNIGRRYSPNRDEIGNLDVRVRARSERENPSRRRYRCRAGTPGRPTAS